MGQAPNLICVYGLHFKRSSNLDIFSPRKKYLSKELDVLSRLTKQRNDKNIKMKPPLVQTFILTKPFFPATRNPNSPKFFNCWWWYLLMFRLKNKSVEGLGFHLSFAGGLVSIWGKQWPLLSPDWPLGVVIFPTQCDCVYACVNEREPEPPALLETAAISL